MLAIFFFLIAVGGLVSLGWWKGGARIGLALAPLMTCSIFLWLGGGIAYQIDFMRNHGLVWPALYLIIPGLIGGYALRFWLKKKLPDEPTRHDRIAGSVIGFFMGIVITWLGLVYYSVWTFTPDTQVSSFNMGVARVLNNGVVRWIPGVGAGADNMMGLVDIATAPEDVQRKVVDDLDLMGLADLPEMQAIVDDPELREQIESLQSGNILALWQLQKNQRILDLYESEAIREVLERVSLTDLSQAVQDAATENDSQSQDDENNDDDQ